MQQFGVKLGLDNTKCLLRALGNPERNLRVFHIAGTNGKGSVCAMLDAMLRAAGYRTGLYTSPHLIEFGERIRVNGEMISPGDIAQGLTRLRRICQDGNYSPTFFELTTALALEYFAASRCDYVVLETGMGGRLDATNVVTPITSVITPIALDHTAWLGDTIEKIAFEKAGIIKPNVPVVSAPQILEVEKVLREKAALCGSKMGFVTEPSKKELSLTGVHQKWNAALAIQALIASGVPFLDEHLDYGLRHVIWPARFQRISERIVIDGSHNPHAIRTLVQTWQEVFGAQKAAVIFGALKDKDYPEMLTRLALIATEFHFCKVASARTADPSLFFPPSSVPSHRHSDFSQALEAAVSSGQPILITGSLFLAGEALSGLGAKNEEYQKSFIT